MNADRSLEAAEGQSARAEGPAPGTSRGDAVPCITASLSCKPIERVLRYGVDSLYLSFAGKLNEDVEDKLTVLKEKAQSRALGERSAAQWAWDSHVFEVRDKGRLYYAFVLEDGSYRIELAKRAARQVPMAYVRVNSRHLSSVTAQEAVDELREFLGTLGYVDAEPNVSRIDLFVDFSSFLNMEWDRNAWVTRARKRKTHIEGDRFTGWSIGQGGPISARLYDKNYEIDRSGKQYLRTLWDQMGWNDGDPDLPGEFRAIHNLETAPGLVES